MISISIFTPTYNRAKLLPRLYKSLKGQSVHVFEWIIVDDGSTDHTEQLVHQFQNEGLIPINYIYQANKGKHFAINKGVEKAKGEYFFIVDSDDSLPTDALSLIHEHIPSIHSDNNLAGVSGRCVTPNGELIGNFPDETYFANALDIRYKHQVTGDLAEVFKTEVLRQFPFPEISGEKFCPEALVWNRIAQQYQLKYFNKSIYTADYQPEGLTSKIVKIRMRSSIASMLHYAELASYPIPIKEKLKAGINFWRFSFNSSKSFTQKYKQLGQLFGIVLLPFGFIMYLNDKLKK
ncbi:MAG: glycosyltransferase [Bacteroidetes bacterium]|jgi:glycosyltransferase involved in cell wall biosynthesis|nr:glycosyltransferase [Bacteroidota bacterium]